MSPALINLLSIAPGQFIDDGHGAEYIRLKQTQNMDIRLIKVKEDIKFHSHRNEDHYLYIISGQAEGKTRDGLRKIGAGDFVVVPGGHAHSAHVIGTEPLVFIQFSSPAFSYSNIQWLE